MLLVLRRLLGDIRGSWVELEGIVCRLDVCIGERRVLRSIEACKVHDVRHAVRG